MFGITSRGDFHNAEKFLKKIIHGDIYSQLHSYGQLGVQALASVTPVDTGLSARSWGYRIIKERRRTGIEWYNTNIVSGVPVVILIQYGHGTGTGGYVSGRDFINPIMRSVFDQIAEDVWKKVIL